MFRFDGQNLFNSTSYFKFKHFFKKGTLYQISNIKFIHLDLTNLFTI